jgi:2'-5' RNA ligase superfamily
MSRILWLLCCIFVARAVTPRTLAEQPTTQDVIAIDVLLEPDATMIHRAKAANALLRKNYPRGYLLDASHPPHISMVQRYVHSGDLQAIAAAVSKVATLEKVTDLSLKGTGYQPKGTGEGDIGVALMTVEVSPRLRRLEDKMVEAIQPFAVSGGTANAFVPNTDGSSVNTKTVKYVEEFVPASSGKRYFAYAMVGLAPMDFLRQLQAEPFDVFSFRPTGVAIYQLGDYGAARKSLWSSIPPKATKGGSSIYRWLFHAK